MNFRSLAFVFICPAIVNAGTTTLSPDRVIIHSVDLQDHLGFSDTMGGDAYDREADEVGVAKDATTRATRAIIVPAKAASYVKFTSDAPNIASPNKLDGDILPIVGVSQGKTSIGPTRYTSEFVNSFVFDKLSRSVQLHVIHDNAGHAATVSLLQAETALQRANSYWGPQVNIVFAPFAPALDEQIDINIGASLDIVNDNRCATPSTWIPECDELPKLLEKVDSRASFNVFYVNSIRIIGGPNNGLTPPGVTARGLGYSIIGATADPYRSTAHELGHDLGLFCVSPPPPATQDCSLGTADFEDLLRKYHLMWGRENGGLTITPFEGNTANPVIP